MSSIIRSLANANKMLIKSYGVQCTSIRNHWNKDFKPGNFPETKEEREAAAAKYNLLPEDYKTYPNDGTGNGDYPNIPGGLGIEAKSPYYPYDFPELKRNFNEPVCADYTLFSEDRYSQPDYPRYSNAYYFICFIGVMSGCFALYFFLENKKMFRPVLPKQYPGKGETHYTFENN